MDILENKGLIQSILELDKLKNFVEMRKILEQQNPADIATIFAEIDEKNLPLVFRVLPKDLASDVFSYMESDLQKLLIKGFSDNELKEIINDMYLDDAVDIIEEMPANVVSRILQNTNKETRALINEVLKYPTDSAGSIMTVEYVSINKKFTVAEAFAKIKREGINKETVYTCYVTERRKLIGTVDVKELLLADYETIVSDIMETNLIFVDAYEDKEKVAQIFSKYDKMSLPVVDKDRRIVGIVTVDDALDVMEDEATEDMEKMAAIIPNDKPYLKTGVLSIWLKRIPWLLLLMVSATFTGSIISSFEDKLGTIPILIAFIPMLMDTGGNAGGQASVTIIRSMAIGEISLSDIFKVIWKEIRVSVLCGVSLAVAGFLKILIVDIWLLPSEVTLTQAMVVCFTLVITVIVAKLVGSSLPILAKRIGFDPAVMASPFITTIVDAISLTIYFQIASVILF